jgi:hypothetical protein
VTGVDAWRLRRILSRALRADTSDFRRDERSRPFHIASFGVDSHGAAAAAWSESARALRFAAVALAALFLAGCPIAVIASLVSGIALGPAGVASPSDALLAVALVVLCGATILLAIVDAVDRGLRGLVASELVARRLRAGRCPVCTKELDSRGGAHALSECGCCGAAWR